MTPSSSRKYRYLSRQFNFHSKGDHLISLHGVTGLHWYPPPPTKLVAEHPSFEKQHEPDQAGAIHGICGKLMVLQNQLNVVKKVDVKTLNNPSIYQRSGKHHKKPTKFVNMIGDKLIIINDSSIWRIKLQIISVHMIVLFHKRSGTIRNPTWNTNNPPSQC